MTTYLLCQGAWRGGWYWNRVARILRAAGHVVFTPTYTGLGERAHLLTREVDLETHIADIEGVIHCEELEDFVLVGHSYGGMVVTGVADHAWEKISSLIYMDAALPRDGQSMADLVGGEQADAMRAEAEAKGEGWKIPFPSAARRGIGDEADQGLVRQTIGRASPGQPDPAPAHRRQPPENSPQGLYPGDRQRPQPLSPVCPLDPNPVRLDDGGDRVSPPADDFHAG